MIINDWRDKRNHTDVEDSLRKRMTGVAVAITAKKGVSGTIEVPVKNVGSRPGGSRTEDEDEKAALRNRTVKEGEGREGEGREKAGARAVQRACCILTLLSVCGAYGGSSTPYLTRIDTLNPGSRRESSRGGGVEIGR